MPRKTRIFEPYLMVSLLTLTTAFDMLNTFEDIQYIILFFSFLARVYIRLKSTIQIEDRLTRLTACNINFMSLNSIIFVVYIYLNNI